MKVKLSRRHWSHWVFAFVAGIIVILVAAAWAFDMWDTLSQRLAGTTKQRNDLSLRIASISAELDALKNQDQYKRNQQLQNDIGQIESAYTQTVSDYEELLR